MKLFDYDFAVLGGGSAGYAAASLAAKLGLRTVVIEGGEEVGGLCILRGCMPSKALLATASRASAVRTAEAFGVRARFESVDGPSMQERKRRLVREFADFRRGQLESGRFGFIRGHARFTDTHTLEIRLVGGDVTTVRARTFLIATGSKIEIPALHGLHKTGFLDSDSFLGDERIPESVIVLGGGSIALEAATFYAGVGTRTTVLQRSNRLLKELDPDLSDAIAAGLRAQGVRVETGVQLLECRQTEAGKSVRYLQNGIEQECTAQEIMCALGRSPSTRELDLSRCGVDLSGQHIRISATQQTSQPHIFAAGDVCGPLEVVHIAIQQGEVAARNAARLLSVSSAAFEATDYRLKLFAVFCEPSVASVGLNEAEAAAAGVPVLTASYPFNDHGKSMLGNQLHGFVKLMVHAESREILGASVVGPEAAELIHEIVVAMHFRATASDLARVPHYHPTLSEIWTYPAEDLA